LLDRGCNNADHCKRVSIRHRTSRRLAYRILRCHRQCKCSRC
jgi:hypothetical protein